MTLGRELLVFGDIAVAHSVEGYGISEGDGLLVGRAVYEANHGLIGLLRRRGRRRCTLPVSPALNGRVFGHLAVARARGRKEQSSGNDYCTTDTVSSHFAFV